MAKRKEKPVRHQSCTVIRTALVRHETLNFGTSKTTPGKSEWKTGPCGIPLFNEDGYASGVCRSCAKGWNHPENYRADGPRPTKIENE